MIRPFGLRDILTIRQLVSQGMAFDLRRTILRSPSPTFSSLIGYLVDGQVGVVTFVCDDEPNSGFARGFLQAQPRSRNTEWDLIFISPAPDYHAKAEAIWSQLLTHLTVRAAQAGIRRIYARAVEDADTENALRQAGYTVVSREEVFVSTKPMGPAVPPKGLRRLSPQDYPAIEVLYRRVVPQLVQQAEGCCPHWCASRPYSKLFGQKADEYVWIEKGRVIAYLGLCSSARGYWLEVVVRSEYRADVGPYIKYVLSLANGTENTPIYCSVPDYGVGLGWVLRTLGFESFARQALLVVHTVAQVRVHGGVLVRGIECPEVGTTVGSICPPSEPRTLQPTL